MEEFLNLLDPVFLIKTFGTIGVIAIIFAESGLFFGFFLPGDSLLFTAGFLASQGYLNFWFLLFGTMIAAILGDSVGYSFGARVGPQLFSRKDSRFFKKEYLVRTEHFFERHGRKAIVLARFVPIVRTFTPILAGVGRMPYRVFLSYNIIGGLLWTIGLVSLGYVLGKTIPGIDQYLLPIILGIIIVSMLPNVWEFYRHKKNSPKT